MLQCFFHRSLIMSLARPLDRFELEEKIMHCWRILDDLKTLGKVYDREHTEDEVLNILIGIEGIYEQRFNELFDTFEACIAKGIVT